MKMRGMAQQLRGRILESRNSYYCRLFQNAALELESAADALERPIWRPAPRLIHGPPVH